MASAMTILLMTADRVVRGDFGGGAKPALRGLWQESAVAEDVVSAAETALFLGGRAGKRVFVLSTDVWSQIVSLPAKSVASLGDDELAQALAFEVEPISGIAAMDSAVGCRALGGSGAERSYWVNQTSLHELRQLEDAIRRAGGKLAGAAHPTGIDRAAQSDAALAESLATELRETGGAASDGPWASQTDDETLSAWLTSCAAVLAQKSSRVPLIKPASRPMTNRQRGLMTAALAALVIVACYAHYAWLDAQQQAAQTQLDARAKGTKSAAATKKQVTAAQKEVTELAARVATLERAAVQREATRAAHRARWSRLLALLSAHAPADLVVQRIEGDGFNVTISGVSLRPELSNTLASALGRELAALGWRVQPAKKQAMSLSADGGPWSFELRLVDAPVTVRPDVESPGVEPSRDGGSVARQADAQSSQGGGR